ncbi:hypothetical protein NC99_32590 [Sunxiuqinia dokdonensis]|uniref:Uncharacterized protein n=1 Tax=Sunxiuqinia dokdonensis TaxID=1409788 RepID=A0A0L8V5Y4_9BACT|nr:hypothetical protein NC99_32590 [Sunxiuqinia dokdonensis]
MEATVISVRRLFRQRFRQAILRFVRIGYGLMDLILDI